MKIEQTESGFTLVELVSVIVLLGILTIAIAPRFMTRDGFTEYTARDQIIAAGRMAQQRAMYDQDSCFRLQIASGVISVQSSRVAYAAIGPDDNWRNGITIDSDVTVNDITIYFDGLGNALVDSIGCGGGALPDTTINVVGSSTVGVCINGVGYVRAC